MFNVEWENPRDRAVLTFILGCLYGLEPLFFYPLLFVDKSPVFTPYMCIIFLFLGVLFQTPIFTSSGIDELLFGRQIYGMGANGVNGISLLLNALLWGILFTMFTSIFKKKSELIILIIVLSFIILFFSFGSRGY